MDTKSISVLSVPLRSRFFTHELFKPVLFENEELSNNDCSKDIDNDAIEEDNDNTDDMIDDL